MGERINRIDMGKRIRQARESLHMSREVLAERIPMSASFLNDVEGGTKGLSLNKFNSLVKALNVSADYILYGNRAGGDTEERRAIFIERINGDLDRCTTEDLEHIADAVRSIVLVAAREREDSE